VGLGLSWGDGYAHHRALLDSAKSISDPSDFFDSLVILLTHIQWLLQQQFLLFNTARKLYTAAFSDSNP
jgi:hypothetical protein